MPLVRLEIRNEFGLGVSERHFAAAAKPNHGAGREDSKVVLDGLAVSGLVGILRQLGDLAEFAAEVFHGLQEQVSNTSSRSHNLVLRVQRIEAALPPLEKAVLAQTSHIHFAYTPGSEWHPRIRCKKNLFIRNDFPHFIMDSYEECRGPPRLHLLDKFDTGGPGSCLKRYSDPTFFKKVSATSDEASMEEAQKDRKARRTKKKRSSKQSADVARSASMPSTRKYSAIPHSGDARRSSSSQTASTVDPGLKYDLGDSLNSFDSRADLGYIECMFRPSCSKQAEEQEIKDYSSSNMVQHSDGSASVSREEHAGLADDSLRRSFLHEQMTSTSSCVTWDEKAEIMEPETKENGVDEILYRPRDETEKAYDCVPCGAGISPVVQQMETLGDHESIQESSVSSQDGIDEIDSEPDNYLDALNTIESESENDVESRIKRGLERFSSDSNIRGADEMDELSVTCSGRHAPKPESDSKSLVSSNQELRTEQPDLILSDSCGHEQMIVPSISTESEVPSYIPNSYSSSHALDEVHHMAKEYSQEIATVTGTTDFPEGPASEPLTSGTSFSPRRTADIQDRSGDVDSSASSNISESRESTTAVSTNSSVKIWTNGGLLGLMPSKPPDFSMASPVNSCKPNLVSPLDSVPGNSSNLYTQNGFTNSRGNELKETITGKSLGVGLNVKPGVEANQENGDNSSLVFGLSRRLLSNSFGKKLSDSDDRQFEPATVDDNVLGQKIDHPNPIVPEKVFKEQFGCRYTVSPTASPPLEHMKISFHPVDGFEASKLVLKFSDGTQSHEKTRDTFPSFQLIPEASNPRHECNSDSDDDTFCRSSPFMSDDCVSHHSDSNSEQWEYGDDPAGGLDNSVYDVLCGVSSMELVPSSLELDGMPSKDVCFDGELKSGNSGMCVDSSICSPILELPSFNAVKPALQQETDKYSQPHITEESSPMPPPLPPMQWRASKPEVDLADEPDSDSEAFGQVTYVKLPNSSISQSPDLGPEDLQHTSKEPIFKLKSKQERNHTPSRPGMDENEFLQQIRAKSFNLRRIAVPEKSSTACGPAASVNVTAILEKASAIRQAVGSDDDTWSDT